MSTMSTTKNVQQWVPKMGSTNVNLEGNDLEFDKTPLSASIALQFMTFTHLIFDPNDSISIANFNIFYF